MTTGHLWYIRRGNQQRGPFPIAVIERNIGLGRIVASDALSPDGQHWHPASEFPDFELHRRAREHGLGRRLEERQHERRRDGGPDTQDATSGRRQGDRRQPEEATEVERRERAYGVWQGLGPTVRIPRLLAPALAVLTLGLLAFGWWARPPAVDVRVACDSPPVKRIAWDGCDKRDLDLRGATLDGASLRNANLQRTHLDDATIRAARLDYADMTSASLTGARLANSDLAGATLRNADLTGTDFTSANLSFADLTGARLGSTIFDGANLSNALWIDGKPCIAPSVGACRLAGKATAR